jgi:hypothetical protein
MNSSKTWKSGEKCRITGSYRCRNCRSAGRETVQTIQTGTIFPMCEACPQKDVTYHLVRAPSSASADS